MERGCILEDKEATEPSKKILAIASAWLKKMAGYTIFSVSPKKQRTKVIIHGKEEIECKEREVTILIVGDYMVDTERNLIYGDDKLKDVKPELMCLLMYFIHHQGEVISKEMLSVEVWENEKLFFRDITALISQLRALFKDNASTPKYIDTIGHKGYCFIAKVEQVSFGVFASKAQEITM